MKIVVAVKQVPERDAALRISSDGRSVEEGDLAWTMNEPDAYALEEALQLKERAGGDSEVVVLCAGPERVVSTLREALAKGADRAIHVVVSESGEGSLSSRDTLDVAKLLAESAKAESADLVLTGLQSDDLGAGQTGVVMAEILGMSHATLVLQVEIEGSGIKVKRELEDGWFQHVEMPLPALLTIQSGGNKLRYATLMGIKRAKSKETRELSAASAQPRTDEVVKVAAPTRVKQIEMLTGTADEVAAKLVEKLKFEVKVL